MVMAFTIVSIVTGAVSAVLWFVAACVPSLPEWIRKDRPQEATPGNFNFDLILGLTAAFRDSSRLNKYAAFATGISVAANALTNLVPLVR